MKGHRANTSRKNTGNPRYVHVGGGVGVLVGWSFWGCVAGVWWFSPRAPVLGVVRRCYLTYGYSFYTTGVGWRGGSRVMDTVTVYDDRGDWNVGLMYGLNITP